MSIFGFPEVYSGCKSSHVCCDSNTLYISAKIIHFSTYAPTCARLATDPKSINDLSRIRSLLTHTTDLYANDLSLLDIPVNLITSMPQVTIIRLENNLIRKLPPKLSSYAPNLRDLILTSNQLKIKFLTPLTQCKTLVTLRLGYNNITRVYSATFIGLPNLKNLYLNNNKLKILSPGTFAGLRKLEYVNLNGNLFKGQPSFYFYSILRVDIFNVSYEKFEKYMYLTYEK